VCGGRRSAVETPGGTGQCTAVVLVMGCEPASHAVPESVLHASGICGVCCVPCGGLRNACSSIHLPTLSRGNTAGSYTHMIHT
jgi:hypothetical protein